MSETIQTLRIVTFVPDGISPVASVAANRAGTYAHFAAGMAIPQVESVKPIPGGHEVTLIEVGDVKARAAALLEKA